MSALEFATIGCPYCGELLELSIDPSVREQDYVEDCQVCCQPILIHVRFHEDAHLEVTAEAENG